MVTINFFFAFYVGLAAVIGAMRGWAKELLVAFSVILGLFILTVLETFAGFLNTFLQSGNAIEFWSRTILILLLTFFGYQTPNIKFLAAGARREKLQDALLGFVLGAVNGYLVFGSLWAFLDKTGYPFSFFISPHSDLAQAIVAEPILESTLRMINFLPPYMLTAPGIYFAVAVAFTFVVIVFI